MRRQPFSPSARRPTPSPHRPTLGLESLEDRTQPATLSLTLDATALVENGPAATATLTRTGDLSQPLAVTIANSDATEAAVPGSVTIPAGSATVTFAVSPVNDAVLDGTQSVTLTATAATGPLTVRPDPAFGTNGIADTPALTGGSSLNPGAILVLPDGRVVAAAASGSNGWAVQWMNPDGSTIVTNYTSFPGTVGPATAYAIARQADGKILVAGDANGGGNITDFAVARYTPDGNIDFTFGTNGMLRFGTGFYETLYDLHVEASGDILVAGYQQYATGFYVARISPAGAVQAEAIVPVGAGANTYPRAHDMALTPDGKIVLAGPISGAGTSAVVRLNADLSPDTTFGPGGYRTLSGASFGAYAQADAAAVAVLADGRVVVGGTVWGANQTNGRFAVARLNADGTPDATFAGDGTAALSLAGGGLDDAEALDLAVQPDGKVVLGGYAWRSSNGRNQALARFTTDGAPDASFNGTGFYVAAEYPTLGSFESIHAIALQPDGRLVAQAGGSAPVTNGNTTTMVDRQWVIRFDMPVGETLTATADLTVADDDVPPPALTLTVSPATFGEAGGAGAATATVTRINASLAEDLVVTLASSDTTEATVPATVTIPAGQASVTFAVAAVDDAISDGDQSITLTATGAGLTATAAVSVTDDEPVGPALVVTIDRTGALEQTGPNAATGTVTRYGFPLETALVVTLASSDTTEANVPATVTIPAGQASATFAIATADDALADGTQSVTITATANGPGQSGPITYDTGWGSGGWVSGLVRGRVAITPDGKMVVAGTAGTAGSNTDFGIYRYNADGTRDNSFGPSANGYVQLNPVGPSDQPEAVLVQPDGKIIVAGYGTTSTGQSGEMVVVRLRANGTLDGTEFGVGGVVRLNFGGGVFANLTDAALQPDGKIVLSGNIGGNLAVIRLNADGSYDTTFGNGGVSSTAFSAGAARAYAVTVAPDGKIVVAGVSGEGTGAAQRLVVARFNADGTYDAAFNGGLIETALAGYDERATDVIVQSDGKVVVAAALRNTANGLNDFAALRFNADGTPDTGFGTNGQLTEAAASSVGGPTRLILQTDGRITVAGTTGQSSSTRARFLRLSPTGALENRNDGYWTSSSTEGVAQDAAGNVYLAYNYASGSSGYVDRYKSVGAAVSGSAGLNVLDNEPFAATNDAYTTTEETTLDVGAADGVRSNDTVTAPIDVRAELVSAPAGGAVILNPDGSFSYTPTINFFGVDTFTYRLRDGAGATNTATVTINVTNVNDAPVAVNDTYTTAEDTPLTVSAVAGQTALNMVSDPGDYIGQGRTYNLSPATGNFSVTGNSSYLTVRYQNPNNASDYWSLTFRSPYDNTPLTAGTYLNAARAAFRPAGTPGLDVTGQHRGSNTLTGQFTILQVETGPGGAITKFAADFEQHSGGATPALRGSIRFNYASGAGAGLLANDSDGDRDPLAVSMVSGPAHGQLTLNPNGTFTYTPDANYSGPDSFTYKATDGTLDSNVATVNLNVTAVNDLPVGVNDTATTAEDTAVTIDAVANDTDVEGDPLFPVVASQPQNGTVTVQNGRLVYAPRANWFGTDTFTYRPSDRVGAVTGSLATVTVTVSPTPDHPIAGSNYYVTDQDVTLVVTTPGVLANDSDADGDPLTARLVPNATSGPHHGTLTFNADGSFTYVPDASFWGEDTFYYLATDPTGRESAARVDLFVLQTNDPPVAANDTATTDEDRQVGIDVRANDFDANGHPLTASVVTQPANGTAAYSANDGRIYYTPRANWHGTDTFTYRVYDGRAYSAPATVTVTVRPVNDAPVAANNAFSVAEDTTLTVNQIEPNSPKGVLFNDGDVDGDALTAVLVSGPASAAAFTLNADGSFTYTPRTDFNGTDTFTYRASDGQAQSATATVTITVNAVNDAPVGTPDALSATEDTQLNILQSVLLGNDTDVDGTVVAIGDFTQPANGTLTRAVTFGGLIYRPNANFFGTDTFTYRPRDNGQLQGAPVTVALTVAAANDAPVGTADSAATAEDTPVSGNVLTNDTDIDGNPLTAVAVGALPAGLTLNTDGSYTYTPPTNFNGSVSFQYRPSDGTAQGNVTTVTLTVSAVNDAPVGVADGFTVDEGTGVGGNVLINDIDVDNGSLTAELLAAPAVGQFGWSTNGSFAYDPGVNFNGTITFTYRPYDGFLYGAATTVTMTVRPVNDAPGATHDTATTDEGAAVSIPVLANDTDIEGDALSVASVTQGANGVVTFTAAGVTYTPAANWVGTDSFTYTVSDGNGGSATASVAVTVNPVNDAPTLAEVADVTVTEDAGPQSVALAGITAGPNESQNLTVTATSSNPALIPDPAVAYASPDATGTLTFAPAANASGTATITVTVSDGLLTTTRQFTVTVTPVNDAPTTTDLSAVTLLEDAAPTNVPLIGAFADLEDGAAGLTYAVVGNTNPALFSAVSVSGGVLRITPAANANGAAVLTVRATDSGGLTVQTTLAVTVAAVNDAPSFVAGANQAVAAGSGARTVGGWATGISRGPADEAGQGLTFVVTTNRPDLFVSAPTIDPATGALTFIPESSATGTATVTVTLRDTGGTANGGTDTSVARTFTITLTSNGLPTAPGARVVNGELIIIGGEGADSVTVSPQGGKVKVQGTLNGSSVNQTFSGVTRVRASTKGGNDTVTFASGLTIPTWTDAGAGDDTVTGGGGIDEIYLGDGNDTADGGAGNDFVAGGGGKDLIQGGAGNDTVYAGDGDDFVIGGPGVDQLFGQSGNDILVGGSAAVRNGSDSLRKVLTDWNPASTGVGGYANLRSRLSITDDGVADRLVGGAGTDWFWESLSVPLDDLEPGEQRN